MQKTNTLKYSVTKDFRLKLPLRNETIEKAIIKSKDDPLLQFKQLINQKTPIGNCSSIAMDCNIKNYCFHKISQKYNPRQTQALLEKPIKEIIPIVRDCLTKKDTCDTITNDDESFNSIRKYMISAADIYRKPVNDLSIAQILDRSRCPCEQRCIKSLYWTPLNRKRRVATKTEIRVPNHNKTAKSDVNLSFSGLNKSYLDKVRNGNYIALQNYSEQKPVNRSCSIEPEVIRIETPIKIPKTLEDMNDVIKSADLCLGKKPSYKCAFKRKAPTERNYTLRASTAAPVKTIYSNYSKNTKEVDYKTFAMLYRIREREKQVYSSSFTS